jgi:hypothetical protein
MSVDDLALLYDGELTAIADQDQLVPSHAVVRRKRPSDPWFDRHCRVAKSELRRLEYKSLDAAEMSDAFAAAAARAAWIDNRRTYRSLLGNKREAFWRSTIDSQHRSPRQLCSFIDIVCLVAEVCRHLNLLEPLIFTSSLMDKWQRYDRRLLMRFHQRLL